MGRDSNGVEEVWFCEGLAESAWRRVAVLWNAPAVPFFRFPGAVDAAAILIRGGGPGTRSWDEDAGKEGSGWGGGKA
jgi:hypothetical protein